MPALRAVVFWMMKNAAESSQMSAAKDATTRANGIGSFAGVSSDGGCRRWFDGEVREDDA